MNSESINWPVIANAQLNLARLRRRGLPWPGGFLPRPHHKSIPHSALLQYYSTTLVREINVSESHGVATPSLHPNKFFEVRFQVSTQLSGCTAVCAGYELKEWRRKQLAGHLIKWLPEFALTYSELSSLGPHNAADLLAKAARSVYTSEKYKKRGEIGELLLHVICREVFNTYPAITKYFYKDSANNTVKGFDSVHVIVTNAGLELWLGESKFYEQIDKAINAAVKDLKAHTGRDYMRAEFVTVRNMLDPKWPHAARLKKLIDPNVSLDNIFDAICIPVLLTYNSDAVGSHTAVSAAFVNAFRAEVSKHYANFSGKNPLKDIKVHLFLFPAKDKDALIAEFDERLKACQAII
jgi:HamA